MKLLNKHVLLVVHTVYIYVCPWIKLNDAIDVLFIYCTVHLHVCKPNLIVSKHMFSSWMMKQLIASVLNWMYR